MPFDETSAVDVPTPSPKRYAAMRPFVEDACVVALAGEDSGETLFAASSAATVYVYVVWGASPVSWKLVAAVVATTALLRFTR